MYDCTRKKGTESENACEFFVNGCLFVGAVGWCFISGSKILLVYPIDIHLSKYYFVLYRLHTTSSSHDIPVLNNTIRLNMCRAITSTKYKCHSNYIPFES